MDDACGPGGTPMTQPPFAASELSSGAPQPRFIHIPCTFGHTVEESGLKGRLDAREHRVQGTTES